MNEKSFELLIKAWEMYQNLAKGFGDSCWKIRAIGIGFWTTILGYSYKESDKLPLYFAIFMLFVFFIIETGLKRLQYKYIFKSLEVEKSLNGILVGDDQYLPDSGISTNIDTPSLIDLLDLLRLKRWMFWLPYLFLVVVTIFCIYFFDLIIIC